MREAELAEINEQKQQKIKKRVETYITADMCRNMDELKEYRDQHGYKNGWVWYMAKKIGILR